MSVAVLRVMAMSIEIRPTTAVADFATVVSGLLDQVSYDEMVLLTDRK